MISLRSFCTKSISCFFAELQEIPTHKTYVKHNLHYSFPLVARRCLFYVSISGRCRSEISRRRTSVPNTLPYNPVFVLYHWSLLFWNFNVTKYTLYVCLCSTPRIRCARSPARPIYVYIYVCVLSACRVCIKRYTCPGVEVRGRGTRARACREWGNK